MLNLLVENVGTNYAAPDGEIQFQLQKVNYCFVTDIYNVYEVIQVQSSIESKLCRLDYSIRARSSED